MKRYGDFEAVFMKELNKHTPLMRFDWTTRDSYITILFEVFMNPILAENKYFTNRIELREQNILIDYFHHYFFIEQKFCN